MMSVREQLGYWTLALVVFILLVWVLADALLPFVLGMGLAYLTDPIANWMERKGMGRIVATVLITLFSVAGVVLAIVLVIPMVAEQVRDLVQQVPALIEAGRVKAAEYLPQIDRDGSVLKRAVKAFGESAKGWSVEIVKHIWSGGMALISFVSVIVVTPVVAFYLLLDWHRLVGAIDDFLPRDHRPTIHRLTRDLDNVLAGFIRGQLTVCLLLGTFYAAALMIVGLKFGLLIGLFAGLISFIPFVGSIMGGLLSVSVAAAQFWEDPVWILVVAVIFGIGQMIEGNYLTPKLVGGKVGLHPVWLLFALSAFGAMFGFVGMLIAVPAAAMIGVVARFLMEQYKEGRLYRGNRDSSSPS